VGYVRVFGQVRGRERERRRKGGEEKSSFPVVALPGGKKRYSVVQKDTILRFFFTKQCIK
jgi:hypothetical protein